MATNSKKNTSRGGKTSTRGKKSTNKKRNTSGNKSRRSSSIKSASSVDRTVMIVTGIVFIVLGVFLFACTAFNGGASIGRIIGNFLKGTMGVIGIIFPIIVILFGISLLIRKNNKFPTYELILILAILLSISMLNSGRFIESPDIKFNASQFYSLSTELKSGGLFGMALGILIVRYLGKVGLYCISIGLTVLFCFLLLRNTSIGNLLNSVKIKYQEFLLEREDTKEERLSKREERAKQKEIIKKNQEIIDDKKEERIKRRNELREKNQSSVNIPPSLAKIRLFPSENEDITKDIFNKEGQIEISQYAVDLSDPKNNWINISRDDFDSRSDGIKFDNETKPANVKQPKEKSLSDSITPKSSENVKPSDAISKPQKVDSSNTLNPSDFNKVKKSTKYKKPDIDLLKHIANTTDLSKVNSDLREKAALLERTLESFNVDAKVVEVTQGPAVTRYEIQPNVGVKVSKIVSLADDIALNLQAANIRIEAPIPGKAAVGIEVENNNVNMVTIREIIESKEYKQSKSKISFAVGRDIAGKAIVANLKDMPHLLIAGSTGSGKSVCINSIITSILYKADPDEVKLVLIDPKVVELGDYNGIPHLLIPVVTDPTKAAAALNWAVAEMTNRYKLFAEAHVRDLAGYNEHLKSQGDKEKMPEVVIIIDELADLMIAAKHQVEESIIRLAQLARAAGMHLIVATQRPSVDVITGVIKANIPSRIAFTVASQFDSKTILDMGGAEKLVGKGDMLYYPLGMGKPIRVQGCFISDEEIHRVIDFVKNQQDVEYANDVIDTIDRGSVSGGSDSEDELFRDAVEFIIGAGKASTSLIQRRFRIGYNRAANIIDDMEARGIIGPADGAKPRQVLISSIEELDGGASSDIVQPETIDEIYEVNEDHEPENFDDVNEVNEGHEPENVNDVNDVNEDHEPENVDDLNEADELEYMDEENETYSYDEVNELEYIRDLDDSYIDEEEYERNKDIDDLWNDLDGDNI